MACKTCKKKVVEQLPQPVDETLITNESKMNDIKRLDFIFKSRNPRVYQTEIKELWKNIFEKELLFDMIVAKRVFQNYIEVNKIVL